MMRPPPRLRWIGILPSALLLALQPWPALAQATPPPARSTHARAHAGRDLVVWLDSLTLFVPAGAVTPGAVVGLGAGGVPGGTGMIVTAAGGLHGDVAVLLAPSEHDQAVIAAEGGTPALVDTATGERRACLDTISNGRAGLPSPTAEGEAGSERMRRGGQLRWIACPVSRPGAYLLGGTTSPPPENPMLTAALARIPSPATPARPPVWALLLIVAAAAGLGAAAASLLGGRPRSV